MGVGPGLCHVLDRMGSERLDGPGVRTAPQVPPARPPGPRAPALPAPLTEYGQFSRTNP